MTKQHVRCAIYTRKSSEEGLEQSFNSLEAQREACGAYILSQKLSSPGTWFTKCPETSFTDPLGELVDRGVDFAH